VLVRAEGLVFEFLVRGFRDQEMHAGLVKLVFFGVFGSLTKRGLVQARFGFGFAEIRGVFVALFLFARFEPNLFLNSLRSER